MNSGQGEAALGVLHADLVSQFPGSLTVHGQSKKNCL